MATKAVINQIIHGVCTVTIYKNGIFYEVHLTEISSIPDSAPMEDRCQDRWRIPASEAAVFLEAHPSPETREAFPCVPHHHRPAAKID